MLLVAGGTVLAQSITAGATPLLTRLYGPDALGALAAVLAFAGVLGPVAGVCLPVAIVLAADEEGVAALSRTARLVALPIGAAAALMAPLFLMEVRQAGVPWGVLVAAVWLLVTTSVAVQIVQQQVVRAQDFALLGLLAVVQAGVFAVAQVSVGLLGGDPTLLIAVSATYSLIFVAVAISTSRYRRIRALVGRSRASVRSTFARYRDFPRYRAPQVLINAVGLHLPTLLLTLVDIRWAGLFLITHRVLALPVLFVGKAISDVIYPRVVGLARRGDSPFALLRKWTLVSTVVSLPIALVLLAAGEWLFALVFGQEWAQAGLLAQAMVPWMVGALICRPVVGAVPALGLQRAYLISDTTVTCVKTGALWVLLASGGPVWVGVLAWASISLAGALWITGVGLRRAARTVAVIA